MLPWKLLNKIEIKTNMKTLKLSKQKTNLSLISFVNGLQKHETMFHSCKKCTKILTYEILLSLCKLSYSRFLFWFIYSNLDGVDCAYINYSKNVCSSMLNANQLCLHIKDSKTHIKANWAMYYPFISHLRIFNNLARERSVPNGWVYNLFFKSLWVSLHLFLLKVKHIRFKVTENWTCWT